MASDEHEALRARIASEEGVGDHVERVKGRTEDELRDDAIALRHELGRGDASPSFWSAVAAWQRRDAELKARVLRS